MRTGCARGIIDQAADLHVEGIARLGAARPSVSLSVFASAIVAISTCDRSCAMISCNRNVAEPERSL